MLGCRDLRLGRLITARGRLRHRSPAFHKPPCYDHMSELSRESVERLVCATIMRPTRQNFVLVPLYPAGGCSSLSSQDYYYDDYYCVYSSPS
jgi:hypothetical protein